MPCRHQEFVKRNSCNVTVTQKRTPVGKTHLHPDIVRTIVNGWYVYHPLCEIY